MFEVLETTKIVKDKSESVFIDEEAADRFVQTLLKEGFQLPVWDSRYHFQAKPEEMIAYLLVLDTLNFCFWPLEGQPRWEVEYDSTLLSGYFALAAALKTAFENGIPLHDATFLAALTTAQLKKILGGQGQLQFLPERAQSLNELGRVLSADYGGKAHWLVAAAGGSAPRLARLLADKLISFRDEAIYKDQKIFFYKRAQIFSADLNNALRGQSWGDLEKMDELTAFADYKLPQVLRHLNILQYQEDLARKIDQKILLAPGSPAEVEIRANTVQAVESIREKLAGQGKKLNAPEIDAILWHLGQNDAFRSKPYHRTGTLFY